jgi:serine/threonine-protein kinase
MDPSSPAQRLVGAVLNTRYRLRRVIGEGGMGAVYEAEGPQGPCAVKVLHEEFAHHPEVRARFFAEAQATRTLVHPHIATTIDAAVAEDGTPYLVMELLRGQSLGDVLDAGKIMSPAETWPVIHQVLSALSAAHAQRIVHRDLKPDNIFLTETQAGAPPHARVLDFGIAKIMDVAGGMGSKTQTGAIIGTPGYMSPEQIRNSKAVDPRSDLWSVGTIVYQMLTGALPFEGDNDLTRLTAVITSEARPIEQVAPHLARFSAFFQRALAKDPAARFQSAEEMSQALASLLRSEVPQAAFPAPAHAFTPAPAAPRTSAGTTVMPAVSQLPPQPQRSSMVAPSAGSMAVADTDPAASPPRPHHVVMPPVAPQGASSTHVSAQQPHGVAPVYTPTPMVPVVPPPPMPVRTVPLWMAIVIGLVGLGLGFALGFLAGGS